MKKKLKKISVSRVEAVKWLTKKPKSKSGSTPLQIATDATQEVVGGVNQIDSYGSLEDLSEALKTLLAAMYMSAGIEHPDSMPYLGAPTEEEVKEAYDLLSSVDGNEGAFEYLTRNLRLAIDAVEKWYSLYHPDQWVDNWDEWYVDDVNVGDDA